MKKAPELRFPEFNNEWKEYELDDIMFISNAKHNPDRENEEYKCIELEHLQQEVGSILGYCNSRDQKSTKNRFNKGQLLFGKLRPYLKKYWQAEFDGVCSSEIWVLEGKKVSNEFLFRLIQTSKFNFIANISSGSKMPRADWSYMCAVPFAIPTKEEQKKIATFFSVIERKINNQQRKVKALEEYRKGIVQKIFSQEIRFKDNVGKTYPNWKIIRLDEVLSIPEKIKEDNILREKLLTVKLNRKGVKVSNSTDTLELGSTVYYKRAKGQLIYGKQNFFNGAIDIVPNELDGYLSSGDVPALDIDTTKIAPEFLLSYLGRSEFYKRTEALATGTGSKRLHESILLEIEIKLPCIEEQRKISAVLMKLDNKLTLEQNKLEQLMLLKKGLLQKMVI